MRIHESTSSHHGGDRLRTRPPGNPGQDATCKQSCEISNKQLRKKKIYLKTSTDNKHLQL